MEEEDREGEEGEDDADVEIQQEVSEVEGPWLGAVEVGAAGVGEDVVLDDVPRDDFKLSVKESVDGGVGGLGIELVRDGNV